MEYLIIWVLFGVASAVLAKDKGRSRPLWFILGLLIGPFAILIQVFLPTTSRGDQDYD